MVFITHIHSSRLFAGSRYQIAREVPTRTDLTDSKEKLKIKVISIGYG